MPIVTVKFDLPEENEDFEFYIKAPKYFSATWEFASWLRQKVRHEDLDEKDYDIFEKVYEKMYEVYGEHDIDPLG